MPADLPHVVTEDDEGIRPAGARNACLYCQAKVGERHSSECVMVRKTIKIELTVTMEHEVPRSWEDADIDSHLNEGSFCMANLIRKLHDENEEAEGLCVICNRAHVKLLETD